MRLRLSPVLLSLGTFLLACGGASSPVVIGPVASVTVSPSLDTIFLSTSDVLTAVARDAEGHVIAAATFSWLTLNGSIASVSGVGQVHGLTTGTTTVTASSDGVTGQATIVVIAPTVASVTVTPASDSVPAGSAIQVRAVARDGNNTALPGLYPTWTSSNPAVATVSPMGLVTGVSSGTATINASVGGTIGSGQIKVRAAFARGDTVAVPLIDLNSTYLGFTGFLYPGGNTVPAVHQAAGAALARTVSPLDLNGNPAGMGHYVLMSIGMSNTTQEWCAEVRGAPCNSWSFTGQALADPSVRTSGLRIANGAAGGQDASFWLQRNGPAYTRIRDSVLAPAGLSERQVQAIWLKVADAHPSVSLPQANADALVLLGRLGTILRTLRLQYPNLKLVFVTSRVYAGYNPTNTLNPEPYAYEAGFSMQWLIAEQIRQASTPGAAPDPLVGDVDYNSGVAPWVGWGPYLWARGTQPRSDGLTWPPSYVSPDGVHPSDLGETVFGSHLLTFFKTSPAARCWFTLSGTCP